ncbi:phage major capsid protein [Salinisphaera sp.]|uniref:phage major capsid protein n=1 Tax=Salinisphaera sp. TaxID=1914330 RepID=UPI000C579E6B|nr:phage major capsid protein [Salinisphaera sp.]MAS10307.1 phage major capsid protein [Salinisphaera sp.]|tara:strand:+ start:8028 stop:9347 length:1320 start_codon:yes stop_codon:yes gene_type:complete
MGLAEQINQYRDSRKAAFKKQVELTDKAANEDRSLSSDEQTSVDELQTEIEQIDSDVARLEKMLVTEQANAEPVEKSHPGTQFRQAKNTSDLSGGIGFAKAARCLALGSIEKRDATQIAERLYGDERIVKTTEAIMTKAAVTPQTADNGLVTESGIYGDFVNYLMPRTIVGNLPMRSVPFRVPLITQDSIGSANWVGEASPKPVTSQGFSQASLDPLKVASIAVASMELLRDSSPAADALIRDSLVDALRMQIDTSFIDPSNGGTANVKPASITNGVTGVEASGADADALRADMKAVFGQFITANRNVNGCSWVMDGSTALAISLMTNSLGQSEFPGIGMNGGTLGGLPVVVSEYVTAGDIYLVDADNIYWATDGGIELSMSDQASIEMNDSPDGTGSLVSLWQNNLSAFRVEQRLNWMPRRANSVARITGAAYGEAAA